MRITSMSVHSIVIALFFLSASTFSGQTAKVYVSSKAGDRIAAKPDLQFSDAQPANGATFKINAGGRFQKINGFGASFMKAAIMPLTTLPRARKEEVRRAPSVATAVEG